MGFYSERVFPHLNAWTTRQFDRHRRGLLESLSGKVLEIGFGSGNSVQGYPSSVQKIFGVEPSLGMRQKFLNQKHPDSRVQVLDASVEALPIEDQVVDAVVSVLVLCSVQDPKMALNEMARVLKPEGRFYFIEHSVQDEKSVLGRAQRKLSPLWQKVACGCHLDRDFPKLLSQSPFRSSEMKVIGRNGFPNFVSPIWKGSASLQ